MFKKHVLKISRISDERPRINKLRLDKNERISNFQKSIIKKIKKEINSNTLSVYPHLNDFYRKLGIKNKLSINHFLITFGIDHALKLVIEAFTEPKNKVIILKPTFAMIKIYCTNNPTEISTVNVIRGDFERFMPL